MRPVKRPALTRSEDAWRLAALLAAGAALRAVFFGGRSLWFDEAITLRLASLPWAELWSRAALMEATPPLHPLLLKAWSAGFADPLFAARAFSWTCGVLSLPLYVSLCRRLAGERWLTPAVLGAGSSFWIHLSQDGRCYALFLLLALAHALLLLDLLEKPGRATAVRYALLTAAGLYTHNFFALVLAAHGAHACFSPARRAWLAAAAAASAAWLPWAPSFLRQLEVWKGVSVLESSGTAGRLLETMGTWLFDPAFLGLALGPTLSVVGAAAFLLLAARSASLLRCAEHRLCLLLCGGPVLAALLIELALGRAVLQTRYLAACSPFFYIALSEAAHGWGPSVARVLRPALASLVAAGALTYLVSARFVDPRLGEVSKAVRAAAGSGGVVVHLEPYYYLPLRYYYLPELTHYLPPGEHRLTYWAGHPGYPAILAPGALGKLGRVTVLDPRRRVLPRPLAVMDGAALEAALGRQ